MNPFDYVTAIYEKKTIDSMVGFSPYLANHSLSNNLDTVLVANEMNSHPNLPPEAQFDFLYHTVRKGRRYGKWHKPVDPPHLEMVMEYYHCSKQKALQALEILTQANLRDIAKSLDKGGAK